VRGNETTDKLTRSGYAQQFVGPEPFLGVSRHNIRRKLNCWMGKQHLTFWRGTCNTQREAWELIPAPNQATGAWQLSLNRTQTKVVIGLLMGHNTLRRHLCIMRIENDPMYRKCGTEEETSVHILCECEALASLRYIYLGSFFLDQMILRN